MATSFAFENAAEFAQVLDKGHAFYLTVTISRMALLGTPQTILASILKNQRDRLCQAFSALVDGVPLSVLARDLGTVGDIATRLHFR